MPRKASVEPLGPPGDIRLEVRVNDKIVLLQRVHAYTIDQQADGLTVTGSLRAPKSVEAALTVPVEASVESSGDDAA